MFEGGRQNAPVRPNRCSFDFHQAILSSKPEGDTQVDDLRRQTQSLSEQEDLQDGRKLDAEQSIRDIEDQWRAVLQAAEEALTRAETRARLDQEVDAFRAQSEGVQSWIRDWQQNLLGPMEAAEKLQMSQVVICNCLFLTEGQPSGQITKWLFSGDSALQTGRGVEAPGAEGAWPESE